MCRRKSDSKSLFPFAAGTPALIGSDQAVDDRISEVVLHSLLHRSVFTVLETHAQFQAGQAGILAGEAVIDASIVTGVLKVGFNRKRPDKPRVAVHSADVAVHFRGFMKPRHGPLQR
jgi:hypothetical protein